MRKKEYGRNTYGRSPNINAVLFSCLFIVASLFMCLPAGAQTITVSGTVKDETGQPVQGVSVSEKGSKSGTQTDESGKFTLPATPNSTLVFTHTRFVAQEIPVSN